jgi:glycosyltransferase involved in cell wall biosynthesis
MAEHVPEWEVLRAVRLVDEPESAVMFFCSKGEDLSINMNIGTDASSSLGRGAPIAKEAEPDKEGITLAMIVKDEEKGIARAIESARGIVEDVVVLIDDTTSDNTEVEAIRAGARTFKHTWPTVEEGGFAEARNRLHEHIKTDWVLVLDGHEYLEGNVQNLKKIVNLKKPGVSAIIINMEGEDAKTHSQVRLYKKDKAKWMEPLHNKLTIDGNGLEAGPTLRVVHDRLGGQTMESMRRRDLQRQEMHQTILPEKIAREGNDTSSINYIQQQYLVVGAMEGVVYWGDRYRRVNRPKQDWPEERFVTMFRAGIGALELRDYTLAMDFAMEAVKADPRRAEGWVLHADILFNQGLYDSALPYYLYVEKLEVPPRAIIAVDHDLHGSTWKIKFHIAMCYEYMGRNRKALEVYDEVLRCDLTDGWRKHAERRRRAAEAKMRPQVKSNGG